jgi:LCP family protein required for cell wall assembly
MNEQKKKNWIRNITLLFCLSLLVVCIALITTIIFSIRPPEGNKTLNRSGRVNDDIAAIADAGDTVPQPPPKEQVFTFLVAGKDKVADNTDTIMMIRLDITHKNIRVLNIPRDTMVNTDRKSKKINSSYLIGGIELFEEDAANLTGFYVNRYVLFDIKGVEKMIDAIGGVDFDVPRNMNYEDPTQDLYIHFQKGFQHLTGAQAVSLARFRSYSDGDIGRIGVQQELLKALAKQALKPENILKIPEIVSLISDNIETDIELNELLWLANEAKDIPVSSIETYMVPGVASTKEGLSYWLPYKNELLELINIKFNPLDDPITGDDISVVSYPENMEM